MKTFFGSLLVLVVLTLAASAADVKVRGVPTKVSWHESGAFSFEVALPHKKVPYLVGVEAAHPEQAFLLEKIGAAARDKRELTMDLSAIGKKQEFWLRPKPGFTLVRLNSIDITELLVVRAPTAADYIKSSRGWNELTLTNRHPTNAVTLKYSLSGIVKTGPGAPPFAGANQDLVLLPKESKVVMKGANTLDYQVVIDSAIFSPAVK